MSQSPAITPKPERAQNDPFVDLREDGVIVDAYGGNYVDVEPKHSDVQFQASMNEERIVHFVIRTVLPNNERHPYFARHRVSELARRAIEYFDQSGGVRGIQFDWGKPPTETPVDRSDNYKGYIDARNTLATQVEYDEAKRAAVRETWTYRHIAEPLHFTRIGQVDELGSDMLNPTTVTGVILRTPSED
ncbi:MAG: hypothetical protein ACREBW_02125 [Candidatus Micrarchaeaceae archaeon]